MAAAESDQQPPEITSITGTRISQRINQILDLAASDPAAAILQARRLHEWLMDQIATGMVTADLQSDLQDVQALIDLLVNASAPKTP